MPILSPFPHLSGKEGTNIPQSQAEHSAAICSAMKRWSGNRCLGYKGAPVAPGREIRASVTTSVDQ